MERCDPAPRPARARDAARRPRDRSFLDFMLLLTYSMQIALALVSFELVAASPPPTNSTAQGWLQKRRDVLSTIWENGTL